MRSLRLSPNSSPAATAAATDGCCSVLQCVAVCYSVLQCVAVYCSVLQCVAVCCSVLQCVAVCCSVLQCVAACCSVLQCVKCFQTLPQFIPQRHRRSYKTHESQNLWYGVATISRLLQIIGLFCRILSLLQSSFATETYNFKEPTNRSHPIHNLFRESRRIHKISVYQVFGWELLFFLPYACIHTYIHTYIYIYVYIHMTHF